MYLSSGTVCLCLLLRIYFLRKEVKDQIRCLVLKVNGTLRNVTQCHLLDYDSSLQDPLAAICAIEFADVLWNL